MPERTWHNEMALRAGPFYDKQDVLSWLGITTTELDDMRTNHTAFACFTADGRLIFPMWQFRSDGTLLPGLQDVLSVLSKGTDDEWAWALWLTGSVPHQLGGKSAVQWLAEGRNPNAVVSLAWQDVIRWSW